MNTELGILAHQKEILLMRSALCRLRLRRSKLDLRNSFPWKPAAIAPPTTQPIRRAAFGLALSLVGPGRAARMVMLAGRIVLVAKLARSLFDYARRPASRVDGA